MQIEAKETRSYFARTLYGIVPDLVLALIVMAYVDDGILIFIFTLIGLQILYLLLWIKSASWNWALFHFFDRKKMSGKLLDYLDQNKYPRPDEYLRDVSSYFEGIIEDEENESELRIKAASEYGAIINLRASGYAQHLLRLSLAYEDAIEQYDRLCRNREK